MIAQPPTQEVPKPPFEQKEDDGGLHPEIVVRPPAPSQETVKELEEQLRAKVKLYEDESMRSKIYRKKMMELQKELDELKLPKGPVRPLESEAENDYIRLVKKCMVAIDNYETEIIDLKKHIQQLEREQVRPMKTEPSKEVIQHHKPLQSDHLNKSQLYLENEVQRLTKKLQATEKQAEESIDRLNQEVQQRDAKLNELRQGIRDHEMQAVQPFEKELEKLRRQIANHKLKQEQSQEIIKELTEGHQRESKRLPGNSKTIANISKHIEKAFQEGQKDLVAGTTFSTTRVRNLLRTIRLNIEGHIIKLE